MQGAASPVPQLHALGEAAARHCVGVGALQPGHEQKLGVR